MVEHVSADGRSLERRKFSLSGVIRKRGKEGRGKGGGGTKSTQDALGVVTGVNGGN
jgi:hypothetical protein